VGDDRMIDIVAEGFDAGIRLGHFIQVDMVAVRLTPAEPFVVVGAPTFFDRYGRPSQPQDLHGFRCILLRQSARLLDRWQFSIDGHAITIGIKGPLIVDDVEACVRAALRGVGLFRLPRSIVLHYLERRELETVLDSGSVEVPGLSLYYPSRSTALPKLRAFVEFATRHMRRDFQRGDYLPSPVT
jgi:DNA-binding transcriptional LysR family regulator